MSIFDLLPVDREKATQAQNRIDIALIREAAGDERTKLINRMIERNIPLTELKVISFLGRHPKYRYLYDELQSVALASLVKAVNRLATLNEAKGDRCNPGGYIGTAITRALGRYSKGEHEQSIRPPSEFEPVTVSAPVNDDGEPIDTDDDGEDGYYLSNGHAETLDAVCQTENERIIIELRLQSFTDEEIGNRIGLSAQRVYQIRAEVGERYEMLRRRGDL